LVGGADSVLLGADVLADGEGDVGVVGAAFGELGIVGSGGISDCFLAVPLASTRAITSAATSSTAATAAIHSQRGAFARRGAGSSGG
jgi:D-serine deaminase-like pyridoxal phosphate-dependent protein